MSRRQWIGASGIVFGILFFTGVFVAGETPDAEGSGAAARYAEHWANTDNQDKASLSGIILIFSVGALICFASGIAHLLRARDDGPLPGLVLAAGAAAAALFGSGAALINGVGLAAAETGYQPDGGAALLVESIGYYVLVAAATAIAVMVTAIGISNRRSRVLPQWTAILSGLLVLAAAGSIYTAWASFMILPLWAAVIGIVLLVSKAGAAGDEVLDLTAAGERRTTTSV